jgi:putative ABC transport system permease protein
MNIAKTPDPKYVLSRTRENVVGNPALFVYNEITPENIDTYHFHGDRSTFPITSLIVVPKDDKSATILGGFYNVSKDRQMIVPLGVIEELMGIVFQVEMFFKANFAMVLVSTALFLVLVVLLSLRIRRREMETMFKIGCSRMTVFWLQAAELVMILAASAVLAAGISGGLVLLAPELVSVL